LALAAFEWSSVEMAAVEWAAIAILAAEMACREKSAK
jgi:hypothetical protein